MSRSRSNSNGVPVSLFPFLAVLLCTMGSLVMLLVAMNHIARRAPAVSVAEAPPPAPAEKPAEPPVEPTTETAEKRVDQEDRREQLNELQDHLARFQEQRDEADEALREDNLRLSQIESHIARQVDHLRSLRAAYQEMIAGEQESYDDLAQANRSLDQLKELIEQEKQEIEAIRQEQEGKSRSFAVLPYRGQNGSVRRPLYIECTKDAVILQPEGLRLSADDFRPPLGPGNPLAAALRASREYYARQNPGAGYDPDTEPYPLILVRPGGILAYYQVRKALMSWDTDFGYEMVSDEMKLAFAPANPALHEVQADAVEQTRMRRAMLARAAPSAYGGQQFSAGMAGETGGGGSGRPYEGQMFGPPEGALPGGGGNGRGGGEAVDAEAELFAGMGEGEEGSQGRAARAGEYAPSEGAVEGGKQLVSGGAAPSSATEAGNGQNAPSATQANAAGGGSQGDPQGASGGLSQQLSYQNKPPSSGNWAVDKSSPTDIAIARPVPVLVHRDRIEVGGDAVAIDGPTQAALPEFVTRVKRQVRSWGTAGQGLYWRPVLKLSVAPDGVERAQDLLRLLQNSGIEISYPQTAGAEGGSNATR